MTRKLHEAVQRKGQNSPQHCSPAARWQHPAPPAPVHACPVPLSACAACVAGQQWSAAVEVSSLLWLTLGSSVRCMSSGRPSMNRVCGIVKQRLTAQCCFCMSGDAAHIMCL